MLTMIRSSPSRLLALLREDSTTAECLPLVRRSASIDTVSGLHRVGQLFVYVCIHGLRSSPGGSAAVRESGLLQRYQADAVSAYQCGPKGDRANRRETVKRASRSVRDDEILTLEHSVSFFSVEIFRVMGHI